MNGTETAAEQLRSLLARVEKLELERPAFVTELEHLAERAHDILDQAESKRGRVAARESKLRKREEQEQSEPQLQLTDRQAVLAEVRARLRAQGKLH